MKVYRVEHVKTGRGPFNYYNTEFEAPLQKFLSHWEDMPTPEDEGCDIDLFEGAEYRCGAPSKKLLRKWFPKNTLKQLKSEGFVLKVYNTKPEFRGEYNIVFNPKNSKVINL